MDRTDPRIWVGVQRLASGRGAFRQAKGLVATGDPSAEQKARDALGVLRSAMDWLEDTDLFEEAHRELDAAGSFVRRTFGCSIHQEGARYEQRCPVALAHLRVGMSIGYVVREAKCSICGQDPEECPHITGRLYKGKPCVTVIKGLDLLEVSLVTRPEQPEARLTAVSVPVNDLRDTLGPDFVPGMPVSCDRCLAPCPGVQELEVSS